MTTTEPVPLETSLRTSQAPESTHDRTRRESLSHLVGVLGSEDATSREGFAKAFERALTVLELDDLEVAKAFQISRPTVGRWVRGDSAPHPVGRGPILQSLAKRAERKIRQLEKK